MNHLYLNTIRDRVNYKGKEEEIASTYNKIEDIIKLRFIRKSRSIKTNNTDTPFT